MSDGTSPADPTAPPAHSTPAPPPGPASAEPSPSASGPVASAAIDLGATSGRVMLGVIREGRMELVQARRFENLLAERDGHLAWDVDALWAEIQQGLAEAHDLAIVRGLEGLSSIGVDSWAVDYVLVGPDHKSAGGQPIPGSGERTGEAIAYRDSRTDGVADQIAEQVSTQRQFALTGIAQQPFNTIYQLATDDRPAAAPPGTQALLLPDYIGYLLTGQRRTETTNASTTGLFSADSRHWAPELLAAAGVEASLFAPFIDPGDRLGTLRPDLAEQLGIGEVAVTAVGSHDTASAVLAAPAPMGPADGPVAYISSGTWSLIGLELDAAVATEEARTAGFTNEGGVAGTVRFLKNVAGMWLVSESIRQWQEEGQEAGLPQLLEAAAQAEPNRFRIDPTDPEFLPPGQMADRVVAATRALDDSGARPGSPAEVVRCILESLAQTYRAELGAACRLTGAPWPQRMHVVGGGSRNALLNQFTADVLGIPVVAGPVEATALGNLALQARALGVIPGERGAIRELVRASVELEEFAPTPTEGGRVPTAPASR